jgi:hypothetical protein
MKTFCILGTTAFALMSGSLCFGDGTGLESYVLSEATPVATQTIQNDAGTTIWLQVDSQFGGQSERLVAGANKVVFVENQDGTSADVYVSNAGGMISCNTTLSIADKNLVGVKATKTGLDFYDNNGKLTFEYASAGSVDSLTLEGSEVCDVTVYLPKQICEQLASGTATGTQTGDGKHGSDGTASGDETELSHVGGPVIPKDSSVKSTTTTTQDNSSSLKIISVNSDYNSDNSK